MSSLTSSSNFFFPHLFLFVFIFASKATSARNLASVEDKAVNNYASAILIFGDSTVDPGNNNYINTPFRSNFPPYGKDFLNQTATGRFTNGRLANDFIANYVGLKDYVPPYLDPNLSIQELSTGVSFASAGSGFDPLTPTISNVISVSKQLEYLKEYKAKLEDRIGKEKMEDLIYNALFVVSADFEVVNSGCCGTGFLEASFLCNPRSSVCQDASKYVYWDSTHPTERTYNLLYQALRPAIDSIIKN
ncbi:GDSL esterase/lipase [Forsythia ovata]|uniref:GDSL esterase/lipase n=1 Tax=Forsythia ovata TaxID=205694 RepID=A0ABD1S2P2_9LAMI